MPDIKLCDLGSVYLEKEFESNVITTLPYRAPDVTMGHKIGYQCDVWSIGCTLFELFKGKILIDAESVQDLLRLIHFKIAPFIGDQVKRINLNLSEDGNKVNILNENALAKMKDKAKKMPSYFDLNDRGEKVLFELICQMLDLNPLTRVKLEDLL